MTDLAGVSSFLDGRVAAMLIDLYGHCYARAGTPV